MGQSSSVVEPFTAGLAARPQSQGFPAPPVERDGGASASSYPLGGRPTAGLLRRIVDLLPE